jgi:hypothetical protein
MLEIFWTGSPREPDYFTLSTRHRVYDSSASNKIFARKPFHAVPGIRQARLPRQGVEAVEARLRRTHARSQAEKVFKVQSANQIVRQECGDVNPEIRSRVSIFSGVSTEACRVSV